MSCLMHPEQVTVYNELEGGVTLLYKVANKLDQLKKKHEMCEKVKSRGFFFKWGGRFMIVMINKDICTLDKIFSCYHVMCT